MPFEVPQAPAFDCRDRKGEAYNYRYIVPELGCDTMFEPDLLKAIRGDQKAIEGQLDRFKQSTPPATRHYPVFFT